MATMMNGADLDPESRLALLPLLVALDGTVIRPISLEDRSAHLPEPGPAPDVTRKEVLLPPPPSEEDDLAASAMITAPETVDGAENFSCQPMLDAVRSSQFFVHQYGAAPPVVRGTAAPRGDHTDRESVAPRLETIPPGMGGGSHHESITPHSFDVDMGEFATEARAGATVEEPTVAARGVALPAQDPHAPVTKTLLCAYAPGACANGSSTDSRDVCPTLPIRRATDTGFPGTPTHLAIAPPPAPAEGQPNKDFSEKSDAAPEVPQRSHRATLPGPIFVRFGAGPVPMLLDAETGAVLADAESSAAGPSVEQAESAPHDVVPITVEHGAAPIAAAHDVARMSAVHEGAHSEGDPPVETRTEATPAPDAAAVAPTALAEPEAKAPSAARGQTPIAHRTRRNRDAVRTAGRHGRTGRQRSEPLPSAPDSLVPNIIDDPASASGKPRQLAAASLVRARSKGRRTWGLVAAGVLATGLAAAAWQGARHLKVSGHSVVGLIDGHPANAADWAAVPFVVSLPQASTVSKATGGSPQAPEIARSVSPSLPVAPTASTPKPKPRTVSLAPAPTQATDEAPPEVAPEQLEEFDSQLASKALANATSSLADCVDPKLGRISTRATVTFAPSGRVTQATLEALPNMLGSPMVGCVVRRLRGAAVPAFSGESVTVRTMVTVE